MEKSKLLYDVMKIQGELDGAQEKLLSLQEVLSREQNKVENGDDGVRQNLATLKRRRQDLLADIAEGDDTGKGDLSIIDKEIAEQESIHDKAINGILIADQTIKGLKRKIQESENKIKILKSKLIQACLKYVQAEREKLGDEYIALAARISAVFTRIFSLTMMCEKLGDGTNIHGPYSYKFKIPSLNLGSSNNQPEQPASEMYGHLFNNTNVNYPVSMQDEIEALENLGIKFPC